MTPEWYGMYSGSNTPAFDADDVYYSKDVAYGIRFDGILLSLLVWNSSLQKNYFNERIVTLDGKGMYDMHIN